jgi:hypothetical protein
MQVQPNGNTIRREKLFQWLWYPFLPLLLPRPSVATYDYIGITYDYNLGGGCEDNEDFRLRGL